MLIKTDKGRQELRPGNRTLGQRERALLLVADGQQSESRLAELFDGEGRRVIDTLLAQGFLARRAPAREALGKLLREVVSFSPKDKTDDTRKPES